MPVTKMRTKWSSGSLIFYPTSNDGAAINFGDGSYDGDVKIFLGSTSEYVEFDVGNSRVNYFVPQQIGTSSTDGINLTASVTYNTVSYSELAAALSASDVVYGSTYNHLYMGSAQTADADFAAATNEVTSIAAIEDGQHAAVWNMWEFSGTASITATSESLTAASRHTLRTDNNLTLGTGAVAAGILIDGDIGSSATINGDTSAIYIRKETGATELDFENGITMKDCVSAFILDFPDGSSGTVISDSSDVAAATSNGYIAIRVGGNTRYLKFWDSAS